MERRLKERLIGAAVLVMLAVIMIPMILDDSSEREIAITETNIPLRPQDDFNSRIVPLKESDLTPVPDKIVVETDTQPLLDLVQEPSIKPAEKEVEIEKTEVVKVAKQEKTKEEKKREKPTANHMGVTAWVVQLGSFSSEENAKGLNEKLRKAGYPAFVEPIKRDSGIAFRVRVGPEILRSDAEALQQKLNKSMQIDGIVIRYP
jgi:DedD protein